MAAFVPFTLLYVVAALGLILAKRPSPPGDGDDVNAGRLATPLGEAISG
jgi:hypothetical protein